MSDSFCDHKGKREMVSDPNKAPKFIRCPKCGRRLKPRLYDCHYGSAWPPCWHYGIPPHKPKGYKTPGKTSGRKNK